MLILTTGYITLVEWPFEWRVNRGRGGGDSELTMHMTCSINANFCTAMIWLSDGTLFGISQNAFT